MIHEKRRAELRAAIDAYTAATAAYHRHHDADAHCRRGELARACDQAAQRVEPATRWLP